jgi:trans-aconitate methyltransferase
LSGKKISRVLDLGCGNGWFTYQVATHLGNAKVLGGDVNQEELDQAERCFQRPNLSFKPIDIFEFETDQLFDLITINAAVQYFPSIKELLGVIQPLLAPGGEFHILDSPVYENLQAATAAKQRTTDYYAKMGVPMMSEHYFHHTKDDFQSFVTKYQPSRNRLIKKLLQPSPFPWLVYQKEDE